MDRKVFLDMVIKNILILNFINSPYHSLTVLFLNRRRLSQSHNPIPSIRLHRKTLSNLRHFQTQPRNHRRDKTRRRLLHNERCSQRLQINSNSSREDQQTRRSPTHFLRTCNDDRHLRANLRDSMSNFRM
jgi:hypothetical protein